MGAKQTVAAPKSKGEPVQAGEETLAGSGHVGSGASAVAEGAPDMSELAAAADAAAACDRAVGSPDAVAEVTCSTSTEAHIPVAEQLDAPVEQPAAAAAAAAAPAATAAEETASSIAPSELAQKTVAEAANPVVEVVPESPRIDGVDAVPFEDLEPEAKCADAPEAQTVDEDQATPEVDASAATTIAPPLPVPTPGQEPTPSAGSEAPAGLSLDDGAKAGKEVKVRTLEQMMSLKPGDDERTEISKKISWILRHGAKRVNVEIDVEGWVRISDLMATDILTGVSKERLFEIIDHSNAQKTRYELKDSDDGQVIRAISKNQRRSERNERADRPDRRERRRDGDGNGERPERYDRTDRGDRRDRSDQDDRGERPMKGRSKGTDRDRGGWWERDMTFDQQGPDGFRRDDDTTRLPRKGDPEHRGKGSYDGKGDRSKGKGKPEKGFGKGGKGMGENGGHQEDGEGWKGGGRYGGRGAGPREDLPPRQKHWRVVPGQDVIVRESEPVESAIVGNIMSGTLVVQIGEERVLKNGIVRMMVEAVEPQAGIRGWVTRSAEAAGGPCFFKPDRSGKDRNTISRGGRGKGGPAKGGGRRPVGEGEGATRGEYNVE